MKNQVYIAVTQAFTVLLSALFLLLKPFPILWMNIIVYVLVMAGATAFLWARSKKGIRLSDLETKRVREAMEKLNFEVQVASSQVASVSEQLHVTLGENNSFANTVFVQTRDMAELNQQVNDHIHRTIDVVKTLMETLEEGGSTSAQLKSMSTASNEVIKKSLTEILEIVETITAINESSNDSLQQMSQLTITSGDIIRMLDVVNNIAKQTHLLSLNASIESARAGEAGKGFAVVADEIRKLALDSSDAVQGINQLITSIQVQIQGVNTALTQNSQSVQKGVTASRSIEENLEKIDASFQDVLVLIDKMSVLSQKEVQMTQEVEENIDSVERVVHSTSQSVGEVFDSVQQQKSGIEDIAAMGQRLDEASRSLIQLFDSSSLTQYGEIQKEILDETVIEFRSLCKRAGSNSQFAGMNPQLHAAVLKQLLEEHSFIEAIWTNDVKGRFVCSIPEAGIANGAVRDWFKQAIQGEEYISTPYISAITKNPCVTISAPVRNGQGQVVGVIGIDVGIGSAKAG